MKKIIFILILGIVLIGFGSTAEFSLNEPISPVDYVNQDYLATFNFSVNLTDGNSLKNASLWTNEDGTWSLRNISTASIIEGSGVALPYSSAISPYNNGNLVSYYKFDEGGGNVVDSHGSNTGNVNNADNTTGILGSAYNFTNPNSDYIQIPHSASLNFTSAMAVSFWVYWEGTGITGGLFSKAVNDVFGAYQTNGAFRFAIDTTTTSSDTEMFNGLPEKEWHHIVLVYDGAVKYAYVDGVFNSSIAVAGGNLKTNAEAIVIGALNDAGGGTRNYFGGKIDEVAFFNANLTINEVQELYNPSYSSYLESILKRTYDNGNPVTWAGYYCNNNSLCEFSAINETLSYKIFQNSNTFNSSSYETASESFILNITANSSLTAVILDYDGTDYSLTNQGSGIWSKTIDVPEGVSNRTLRYKFTYAGDTIYSDYFYQNVQQTVFTICNATYTNDFLNISFKDEGDSSYINASISTSTFTYYLGSGNVNKSYTYVNSTDNYYYDFCASPTDRTLYVVPYVQYKQGTDYPQRIWNPSAQSYTSTVTNKILYLLSSVDGIYVTFQVINSADQVISGVDINATRLIDSVETLVGVGTTGASGSVTFWLNPDFLHTFTFYKSGYDLYTYDDTPTQTSYTITLGGGQSVPTSYIKGINYTIYPSNTSLLNDTIYTFGFVLTTDYWDVSAYGFNLRLKNGTIISGGSTTTEGTLVSFNYNVTNQTRIYLDYYWVINDTYTNGTRDWRIYSTSNTGWSIKAFFTDLSAYLDSGLFGIDNFGRYLIVFLILFFTAGILGYKYGITNPLFVTGIIFFIIFFLDVSIGIIPSISVLSGNEIPHLLTFISGLIFVITLVSEVMRR